ncbi:hypothetical protein Btru_063828 [Bulinus truncatus]|nr:hypothetical protein Btru_063828 [Bulinus truncatus]
MATSKLYPTLSSFYRNTYVGFGSEANLTLLTGGDKPPPTDTKAHAVDNKVYRKPLQDDHSDNKLTTSRRQNKMDREKVTLTDIICPSTDKSKKVDVSDQTQRELTQNERNEQLAGYLTDSLPCLPTAPPLDWSDELIERFLADTLTQQELSSLENDVSTFDIPSIDYSTLRVPPNVTGNRKISWVDDLIPDYDETDTDSLNNLNKEISKEPQPSGFVHNIVESRKEIKARLNPPPKPETTHQSHPNYPRQPQRQAKEKVRDVIYVSRNIASDHSDQINAKVKHLAHQTKERKSENVTADRISPSTSSDEYSAWMTWRKQVNRQLATAILLRKDNEFQQQNSGMCKKSLNQSSFDIISQYARCEQKTPLGGKPFVMYGIPRVSLPNN